MLEAGSGAEALAVAKAEKFDAVLLDVGLPDADGREVCLQLRKAQVTVPIIMVTASSGEADTIRGPRFRRQRLHRQAVSAW